MFVALRDLRFAKGRFGLMLLVITLVAYLVGVLSALTAGLARESTSAITELPIDRLAFSVRDGDAPQFTASTVTTAQVKHWQRVSGVSHAEPVGLATTRMSVGQRTTPVTVIGVGRDTRVLPAGVDRPADGGVVLSRGAADDLGDPESRASVAIGSTQLSLGSVSDHESSFAHTPVVWVTLDDWQRAGLGTGKDTATVVAIDGDPRTDVRGMTALTTDDARSAISSFSSENGSLRMITGFLVVISMLVIGAFFSVWTAGRTGDIAVLKALGASDGYLLRDAVGQAALVLAGGVLIGSGLAGATAVALAGTVPAVGAPTTFAGPAVTLVAAGLVGAAVAVWRITRVDPHAALAAR